MNLHNYQRKELLSSFGVRMQHGIAAQSAKAAVDAKVTLDDNALFRHKDLAQLRDLREENQIEVEAGALETACYLASKDCRF